MIKWLTDPYGHGNTSSFDAAVTSAIGWFEHSADDNNSATGGSSEGLLQSATGISDWLPDSPDAKTSDGSGLVVNTVANWFPLSDNGNTSDVPLFASTGLTHLDDDGTKVDGTSSQVPTDSVASWHEPADDSLSEGTLLNISPDTASDGLPNNTDGAVAENAG